MNASDPLKQARNNTKAAEELANELKRVLENSIGDSDACLCDDKCNAAAYGTHTAGLRQESQRSQTSSAAASDASLVGIEQIAMVHLQNGCDDVDLLRKRMLQQLEVEKEMRGCVEEVLSKERAHSRKLQHLLSDAESQVRRLSRKRFLTADDACAISSAHEAALGRERADAAMAVREMKTVSERAILEYSAAWETERRTLNEEIVMLRESKATEIDELQSKLAIVEGALCRCQKDSEIAVARSRAQNRVMLRKMKAHTLALDHPEFLELEREHASLIQENSALNARISELDKVGACINRQLAHERGARESAEDRMQASQASQKSLQVVCDEAASEIRALRNEVNKLKILMHKDNAADGGVQSKRNDSISNLESQVQQAQEWYQDVMVEILNTLDPERISRLLQIPDRCQGSNVRHVFFDREHIQAVKVQLASSLMPDESIKDEIMSWLGVQLEHGLQALQQARESQAVASREAADARAEVERSALAAQADIQQHHGIILGLQMHLKQRNIELEGARSRLDQAAASAQSLAGTLAEQESEIFRLQGALSLAKEQGTDVSPKKGSSDSTVGHTESLHSPSLQMNDRSCQAHDHARADAQMHLENINSLNIHLQQCKTQLESRDCRIRELREALTATANGDTCVLEGKLKASVHEVSALREQLRSVQGESSRWQAECHNLSLQIAAFNGQLQDYVHVARLALQKMQEPAAVIDQAEFDRSQLNAKRAIAKVLLQVDQTREAGDITTAATNAISALVATLEAENQRALRFDMRSSEVLVPNIKALQNALHRAQCALSEGNMAAIDEHLPDQPPPGCAAEAIAAMLPSVHDMVDKATALHMKLRVCSCSLTTAQTHVGKLTEELKQSRNEVANFRQDQAYQIQTIHETLQAVKRESTAAQGLTQENSRKEAAEVKQALTDAQKTITIRTDELYLCQTCLDKCNQEVEEVKLLLGAAQADRLASQQLVCSLQTDLNAAQQKINELQSQLAKSRAATARAKLSINQTHERQTRPTGNATSTKSAHGALPQVSAEADDVSALVHQLDTAHRRLMKFTKDKAALELEIERLQSRYERLEAVHAKVCERRAGADISTRKLSSQVDTLKAELQQAEKAKEDQQRQLCAMASQLSAAAQTAEQATHERKEWMCQLASAKTLAQDSRLAVVRNQARCDELTQTLAEARLEVEATKEKRMAAEAGTSEVCSQLDEVQEALKACEADLAAARQRKCSHAHWCTEQPGDLTQVEVLPHHADRAPLCPTTCCINIPQKGILTHDSDAKSIRIQQLRETMISISAEKAALSDAVDACHLRIAQMECVRANDLQGPCQADKASSPCWEMHFDSNIKQYQSVSCQTGPCMVSGLQPSPARAEITHLSCSMRCHVCDTPQSHASSVLQSGQHGPGSPGRHDASPTPCSLNNSMDAHNKESRSSKCMDEILHVNLQNFERVQLGQQTAKGLSKVMESTDYAFLEAHACTGNRDCPANLIQSLEATSASLFQQLEKLKGQSTAEVHALQEQLQCAQHGEEIERKEKKRLQSHVEAVTAEAAERQHDLVQKEADVVQTQSELSKLRLERMEEHAKADALSKRLDDARMEMQNAILRAAGKEDDLEKTKSMLGITEAELSANKRRIQVIEASKSQLHDRLAAVSEDICAWKDRNENLEREIQALRSKQKVCEALELQLRADLVQEQQRANELVQTCRSQTIVLEGKTAELARCVQRLKIADERVEKMRSAFQDISLQIVNLQKDRAKAQEQSAADFKALVDARKEVVGLKKKIAELEHSMRKQAPRAKGKTLADVYKGGTMRRDNGAAMEEAAREAIGSAEAGAQAKESCGVVEAMWNQQLEAKDLEIMDLKQQLAAVTEELAMAAALEVHVLDGHTVGKAEVAADWSQSYPTVAESCANNLVTAPGSPGVGKPCEGVANVSYPVCLAHTISHSIQGLACNSIRAENVTLCPM